MKKELKDLIDSFSDEIQYELPKKKCGGKLKRMASGGWTVGGTNISYNNLTQGLNTVGQVGSSFNSSPSQVPVEGYNPNSVYNSSQVEAQQLMDTIGNAIPGVGQMYGAAQSVDQWITPKDDTTGLYKNDFTASLSYGLFDPAQNIAQAKADMEEGDIGGMIGDLLLPGLAGINYQADQKKRVAEEEKRAQGIIDTRNRNKKTSELTSSAGNSGGLNRGTMYNTKGAGYYNRAKGGNIASPFGISKLKGGTGSQDSIKLGDIAMVDDGEVKFGDYIFSNVLKYNS